MSATQLPSTAVLSAMPLDVAASETIRLGAASATATSAAETISRIKHSATRLPFLDFLRAIASQLILLHHVSFYGPLAECAYPAAPTLMDWLMRRARMAVQVFFVLGGFFTASSLSRSRVLNSKSVALIIAGRYRRIGLPYLAALIVAILANALARRWMTHEAISASPTWGQLLAHATFLHDILGYQALTAGIWYLAIDFQLFLLCLGVFWASQAWLRRNSPCTNEAALRMLLRVLSPLAVASLLWFNRHAKFDAWAIYFVGSYFLGMLLHELLQKRARFSWVVAYWGLVIVAAVLDPRPRLLVASATALIVFIAARLGILQQWPKNRVVDYLGRISYSLFLIHFPVLLLVNAWGSERLTTSTGLAVFGLILAYALSLVAGVLLYHGVESRVR